MDKATKWRDISFVVSSAYRNKVLRALENPKMPLKLSKELGINKTHISRALYELESKKLIKCLTPEARKGKIYEITDYGKEVIEQVFKL
ncbi:MAG: ArsR family transcriptional regulator [Nanoarchaeota archaeon]